MKTHRSLCKTKHGRNTIPQGKSQRLNEKFNAKTQRGEAVNSRTTSAPIVSPPQLNFHQLPRVINSHVNLRLKCVTSIFRLTAIKSNFDADHYA